MVFDLWCMYRWDHWVMDVLTCNLGGIIIGHMIMRYYSMKQYRWMNVSGIPLRSTCSRVGCRPGRYDSCFLRLSNSFKTACMY